MTFLTGALLLAFFAGALTEEAGFLAAADLAEPLVLADLDLSDEDLEEDLAAVLALVGFFTTGSSTTTTLGVCLGAGAPNLIRTGLSPQISSKW